MTALTPEQRALVESPYGFAKYILGIPVYDGRRKNLPAAPREVRANGSLLYTVNENPSWQREVFEAMKDSGARVSLRTANGSGKTSTIITGLTLPIALIGTFLFMYMLGFTINMISMMALSLCVGLLIDDAIVVRENIVRHVQMGKSAYQASLDGTQEIGLAVLATTLSIVAVFLPIGFMEGIIGKFFHEFGITIVAAVLISMFVSFTLDPMLSSIWHDPAIDRQGQPFVPKSLYDHTLGRVTHWFDQQTEHLAEKYQAMLAWALDHKKSTLSLAVGIFISSVLMVPLLGTEFIPKGDYSETSLSFQTPVGTSLETTALKAKQVEQIVREFPEVQYTLTGINTPNAQGKNNASIYIHL